jgi:uncharacterized cupredoxin-like copper-binding protein
MMKRILLAVMMALGMCGVASADGVYKQKSLIGPTTATAAATVTTPLTSIVAAPGSGLYNCVTDVYVVSAGTFTFRILDGATTSYAVLHAANVVVNKSWDQNTAWCASAGNTLTLSVDNGTAWLNYKGFVGQ